MPSEGLRFPGVHLQVLVEPADVEGRFSFLAAANDPGWESELNRHEGVSKVFFILDGSYEVVIDDRWHDARRGEAVLVPGGTVHGFRAGPAGGRALMIYPPASAGFFAAVAERDQLYRDHAIEGLGPLPGRS
jgi:mannose-6-phosphate isomerase-like protein (cupin superfamily)